MGKKVDKDKKRVEIALSAKELILSKGIDALTVAEVAHNANIGKGTLYEYFNNKNEIVFTLTNVLIQQHLQTIQKKITTLDTTREKIHIFATFFYEEEYEELREIYKQFISLSLMHADDEIFKFHKESVDQYYTLFEKIIKDGIEKKELKEESVGIIRGLFSSGEGLFIRYSVTNTKHNLKKDLQEFLETIFDLMER